MAVIYYLCGIFAGEAIDSEIKCQRLFIDITLVLHNYKNKRRYDMTLDVKIKTQSISIDIKNPFRADMDAIYSQIEELSAAAETGLDDIDIKSLVAKMIRGIAGCEDGCPANAKSLVSSGHEIFALEYVEGGILVANATLNSGAPITLKMFPDF